MMVWIPKVTRANADTEDGGESVGDDDDDDDDDDVDDGDDDGT